MPAWSDRFSSAIAVSPIEGRSPLAAFCSLSEQLPVRQEQ